MKLLRFYQRWHEESFGRHISIEDGDSSRSNLLRSPWFVLSFLILLSMTVSLFYDAWLFTPAGFHDPWMYVGYGYTFDDQGFGGHLKTVYYKLGRIPWVYLQHLVRKFFSPLISTYILQYSCLWLGVFSVYFTIRRLLGHIPAFLAAVFLCIYAPFLGSGGADYHNTLVGPLYAFCFLILTIAAEQEKRALWWLLLFGCIYGMTVYTMILYVNFAPILVLHFYVARKMFAKEFISFKNFLLATFSGVILATVICGLVSVAYGYRFLFFIPQLGLTKTFLSGHWSTSPWWSPWTSGWVLNAYWLAPLAAMMIFAFGALLFLHRSAKSHPRALLSHSLNLQFLCLGLVWLFWQLLKKDTLNTSYFAYPLIIPFAMSIAASFSLCLSYQFRHQFLPIILGIAAIIALSFKPFAIQNFFHMSPFILIFLLFAAVLSLLFFYKRGSILAVVVLAFASIFPVYYERGTVCARDAYLAITEATQWIYNTYGRYDVPNRAKQIFIWFDENSPTDPDCPLRDIGYSLTNTTFDYVHYPYPMPSIQNLKIEDLKGRLSRQETKVVVLITKNENDVKALQNRLEQAGFSLDFVQFREFHQNKIRIPLYVLKG